MAKKSKKKKKKSTNEAFSHVLTTNENVVTDVATLIASKKEDRTFRLYTSLQMN